MPRNSDALLKEVRKIVAALPPLAGPFDQCLDGLEEGQAARIMQFHARYGGADLVQLLRRLSDEEFQEVRAMVYRDVIQ